jgi:hypothetical protein
MASHPSGQFALANVEKLVVCKKNLKTLVWKIVKLRV